MKRKVAIVLSALMLAVSAQFVASFAVVERASADINLPGVNVPKLCPDVNIEVDLGDCSDEEKAQFCEHCGHNNVQCNAPKPQTPGQSQ